MRKTRIRTGKYHFDRRLLFAAVLLLGLGLATINCSGLPGELPAFFQAETLNPAGDGKTVFPKSEKAGDPGGEEEGEYLAAGMLWADLYDPSDVPEQPTPTHDPTQYMSLDVRDANLLDVLSLIAYKLDGNIIFLEEPSKITIKTSRLSPVTTLQTVLQKEGLDYLTIGRNYIVGQRGRLYQDFANRMYLSRFNLFYVSPQAMEGFIQDFNVPIESLSVDVNQHALWMQGTPMALGKAREIINSLDVMSNAAFGEGGSRKIRMPVSKATGNMARDELNSLINILSILLDGFRDNRTDLGWGTWDHPGPVPRITMDWSTPVINPYDIKMKITPDLDPTSSDSIHFLIAEGTPQNIDLIKDMIQEIRNMDESPFRFSDVNQEDRDHYYSWNTIARWEGEGIKSTERFTTSRDEWLISWRAYDEKFEDGSILQIYVYDSNKNLVSLEANVTGPSEDSSYVRADAGDFYLEINSANIKWEVMVKEKQRSGMGGNQDFENSHSVEDSNKEEQAQQQSYTPPQAYYVGLNAVPPEGGRLSGAGAYISGSSVTVSVVTSDGYRFVRWIENGFEVSTNPSYTFYLYGNRNLEAVFTRVTPADSTGSTGEEDLNEAESEASGETDPPGTADTEEETAGQSPAENGEDEEDSTEDNGENND